MNAIETQYRGYRFRSRLEARWAVYFDALELRWEYEREGYYLPGVGRYLPDFWLPQPETWAEVKPAKFAGDQLTKVRSLVNASGYPCLLLEGTPDLRGYRRAELVAVNGNAELAYRDFIITGPSLVPMNPSHREQLDDIGGAVSRGLECSGGGSFSQI